MVWRVEAGDPPPESLTHISAIEMVREREGFSESPRLQGGPCAASQRVNPSQSDAGVDGRPMGQGPLLCESQLCIAANCVARPLEKLYKPK